MEIIPEQEQDMSKAERSKEYTEIGTLEHTVGYWNVQQG